MRKPRKVVIFGTADLLRFEQIDAHRRPWDPSMPHPPTESLDREGFATDEQIADHKRKMVEQGILPADVLD